MFLTPKFHIQGVQTPYFDHSKVKITDAEDETSLLHSQRLGLYDHLVFLAYRLPGIVIPPTILQIQKVV